MAGTILHLDDIFCLHVWYCRDKLHLMEIRSMCWAFWSLSCVLKERNDWKFKTLTSEGNFVIVSLSVVGEEIATGKTYIVCITVKSTQYLAFDFLSPEQCSWINFGSQQSGYCFYFPVNNWIIVPLTWIACLLEGLYH